MKKIALLFLVHKNPEQLSRLLCRLDDERFDFYIHVDSKTNINDFLYITDSVKKSKIVWVEKRTKTFLYDFSLIKASVDTLIEAYKANQYLYYVLLTGQDYPIKSNDYVYNKLCSSYPMTFIDMYGVEEAYKNGIKWVENIGHFYFSQRIRNILLRAVGAKLYFGKYGKIVKLIPKVYDILMTICGNVPRKEIHNTEYVYSAGSHFWMLPDIAAKHVITKYNYDNNINKIFHHVVAPEESYFQTILSTMKDLKLPEGILEQFTTIENEMDNPALRLIKWYENGKHTSGHPAIWDMNDLNIIDNAQSLFARKFDITVDKNIFDYLDNI